MSVYLEALETQVREALDSDSLDSLRPILADQYAADIADILERLDDEDKLKVFRLLEPELAAEVLDETGSEATRSLLRQLPAEQVGDLLDQMPMDDVLEILTEDVPELKEELLAAMEPDDAAEVRDLLQYPEHSAGRLMTQKFVRIPPNITVSQALQHLRRVDSEVETVNDLYVLNGGNRLIGVVSLREVITSPPERRISDIMETDVITASPETDQEEVARMIARYDFLAMPIVAQDGRMLGIVTVDDAIDVLAEEHTEDMLRLGAVSDGALFDQPYFTVPLLRVLRSRFGWLLLLFLADTLTGTTPLRGSVGDRCRAVFLHPAADRHRRQHRLADGLDDHSRTGRRRHSPVGHLAGAAPRAAGRPAAGDSSWRCSPDPLLHLGLRRAHRTGCRLDRGRDLRLVEPGWLVYPAAGAPFQDRSGGCICPADYVSRGCHWPVHLPHYRSHYSGYLAYAYQGWRRTAAQQH